MIRTFADVTGSILQDIAKCLTLKVVTKFFKDNDIKVLSSPDLNPKENL